MTLSAPARARAIWWGDGVFLSYLRRHIKTILMLVLFAAVCTGVFSLYRLPLEAVFYAALLCLVIGAALFFVGYARYVRQHRQLRALLLRGLPDVDALPKPEGALEADYQTLLRAALRARDEAESASAARDRALTDYYTLWAHQIKTPISAMRLLLSDGEDGRAAALSAELLHIEQYVEMALVYLRAGGDEAADLVLHRSSLDDIVRGCVRRFSRLFILKHIALSFGETGLSVLTDEKWLAFVIGQLLSNSLKYTPPGGRISVFARGRSLIVADTGIGIRPEDLPRIFEKGFTGYNGREDKKSTGIGLYLCRLLCDRLGHGIAVESAPGSGSRVTLTFGPDDLPTE